MEGARRDEENVVGLYRAMLRRDGRSLDQRQQVALHAFAAHIAALLFRARTDLVHLVEKDDAVLFDRLDRLARQLFLVEQLVALLRDQNLVAVAHLHPARLGAPAKGLAHNVGEIDHADLTGHAGNVERRHARARIRHFDLDFLVVEFAIAKLLAETFLGGLARIHADQRIDDTALGGEMRFCLHILALLLTRHRERDFHEIADDLFDVAADIADFGEFRRFHLHEGRLGELGEAARDFRLADAGRPDHQDVLRQHLVAQLFRELLAAPAVPERNGDGALCLALADNIAVEFGNDLTRRKTGHRITFLLPPAIRERRRRGRSTSGHSG